MDGGSPAEELSFGSLPSPVLRGHRMLSRERPVPPQEALLSAIIPTLNEASRVAGLITDLQSLPTPVEIIVADGGSTDETVAVAEAAGARVIRCSRGRGQQLGEGAEAARGSILCFLHADVRLDSPAMDELSRLNYDATNLALAFRLRIDAPGVAYRILETGANLRTRVLGLPYGDQGLIVSRDSYDRSGGYPPIPLMEDVALMQRLRRDPGVRLLRGHAVVSDRRWQRDGVTRRTLLNLVLLFRFLTGTDPERLVGAYEPEFTPR